MPPNKSRRSRSAPRLYVDTPLLSGAQFEASPDHTHYLLGVLRRNPGDPVIVFNGRDGEWSAHIATTGRRNCTLSVTQALRAGATPPALTYYFAPLKRSRLDYVVQKATELGAGRIVPVITHHTNFERIKKERLRANIIEAVEQCGAVWLPELTDSIRLEAIFDDLPDDGRLIFCDESAEIGDPLAALTSIKDGPVGVLVGPEGGFSVEERSFLNQSDRTIAISLGPRILRADTAGVAVLSLVQAVSGGWTGATG